MSPTIPGRATPEATNEYCRSRGVNLQPSGGNPLGKTGLQVSGVGFGCYRIAHGIDAHEQSFAKALTSGVDLIDTSANYADGESEVLVGKVMRRLIDAGEIRREEIVVVTKGGYIQGQNLEVAHRREQLGSPFPEVSKLGDDLWHCIHPDFLSDQIERSLGRMELASANVYLLHNPEYFLEIASQNGMPLDAARDEYYRRIKEAFFYLETQTGTGRIGCYGISSNSFPHAADDPDFTSLERCWEIAQLLGPNNHFRVIQLPANLFETGAWMERNQSNGTQSLLEFAEAKGLGVLINRPLNAIMGGRLLRLADPSKSLEPLEAEIDAAISLVDRIEGEGRKLKRAEGKSASSLPPSLAKFLAENWRELAGLEGYRLFLSRELSPVSKNVLSAWADATGWSDDFRGWQLAYVESLNRALSALGVYFESGEKQRPDDVHEALAPLLAEHVAEGPLSQKAIWVLRSLPGVTCVLVGMRREEYVEDCLAAASLPLGRVTRESSEAVLTALRSLP